MRLNYYFVLVFVMLASCSSQKSVEQRVNEYCTSVPVQTLPTTMSNDEGCSPEPSLNSDRKMAVSDCLGGEIPVDEENIFDPADELLRE